jgi:hypothetical protein
LRLKGHGFDLDTHIKVAHVQREASIARANEQYKYALKRLATATEENYEDLFNKALNAERKLKALGAL